MLGLGCFLFFCSGFKRLVVFEANCETVRGVRVANSNHSEGWFEKDS